MSGIPTGTELMRPFLPAKDFGLSKRFYEALGFEKLFDGEVVIFSAGSGGFILQNYYQKEWAENFMMQLVVDDLEHVLERPAPEGTRRALPAASAEHTPSSHSG